MLKWQTGQCTILQLFLKICCLDWSLYLWFWAKKPACHPMDQRVPDKAYTCTHTCTWTQIKIQEYFWNLSKCAYLYFSFLAWKDNCFLTLSWDHRAGKQWWVGLCRDLTWDILCSQVWHQWPRTKVCSVSWDLLSWALNTGCQQLMGWDVLYLRSFTASHCTDIIEASKVLKTF